MTREHDNKSVKIDNDSVKLALNISDHTLKKIRSLLVHMEILKKGDRLGQREFEIVKYANDYVKKHPGVSYQSGIMKALEVNQRLNFVDSALSPKEHEELENYEAMEQRYGKLWENYIFMSTSLSDLARELDEVELGALLKSTLDLTSRIIGSALRSQNN